MIVYVDKENKCHTSDDGTMTAVETDFFDGKCETFIEGYCYEAKETSVAIYPWKDYDELDAAQREYERQMLAEYQENSIPTSELEAAYQEGVNSAYG